MSESEREELQSQRCICKRHDYKHYADGSICKGGLQKQEIEFVSTLLKILMCIVQSTERMREGEGDGDGDGEGDGEGKTPHRCM